MFIEQEFVVRFVDGRTVLVDNIRDYIYSVGSNYFFAHMIFHIPSKTKKVFCPFSSYWGCVFHTNKFYVYTENNMMVSPDLLIGELTKFERELYMNRKRRVRVYRPHHTHRVHKKMQTQQELRATKSVLLEEGEPAFRSKRTKRYLPSSWDDLIGRRSSGWKQNKRKKQYKGS